ncbi:hypothetical protein FA13DRAFT_225151 [Coprinellus micaceus]|uniref:Uncharacterized protein n=1 Tax=Coprinellus micaceus TaxID=71717 RepID=A0A4Y7TF00_COPMI|nr:hypothetical protein FA13DRAFT_225151 [Coprinellus micaceus]
MWWFDVSCGLAGCHRDPARSAVRKTSSTPPHTPQTKIPWQYSEPALPTSRALQTQRLVQLEHSPVLTTKFFVFLSSLSLSPITSLYVPYLFPTPFTQQYQPVLLMIFMKPMTSLCSMPYVYALSRSTKNNIHIIFSRSTLSRTCEIPLWIVLVPVVCADFLFGI